MTKLLKIIALLVVLLLCATVMIACDNGTTDNTTTDGNTTTDSDATTEDNTTDGTEDDDIVVDEYAITDSTIVLTVVYGDDTFTFTKDELCALDTAKVQLTRTNSSGVTTTGTYTGVTWATLADAVGCSSSSNVLAVSSDSYQSLISSSIMLDADSLFALYQEDEYIESEEDGYIWFCASENYTANYWVKYIVTLTVQ